MKNATSDISAWVNQFAHFVTPAGTVLDLACGTGRHSRFFAQRGHNVLALDRDVDQFIDPPPSVRLWQVDLESAAWPLPSTQFDCVVVTNYLHRPLFSHIVNAVAPGGLLIYETFAVGNAQFGKPSNPNFLLQPGELLRAVGDSLRVLAYQDLTVAAPKPACVQSICARREQ